MRQRKPGLLQRVWGFDSRHPLWWDAGPVMLLLAAMLFGTAHMDRASAPEQWFIALVCLLFMVPLIWRRRLPFAVYVAQIVPSLLTYAADLVESPPVVTCALFGFLMSLYNLALRRETKYLWWAAGIAGAQMVIEFFASRAGESFWDALTLVASTVTTFLLVTMIALMVRTRRAFHAAAHDQAAREAVAEERGRIAREMHDIIGHNLAVINALADGGAYAAAASPDRAREALEAIGSTSRQALSELRRVLSVLRADEDDEAVELAPQPGMADLGPLVERVREAGLPLTFATAGRPWELSENQQLAVYRTVQESLTNILKHVSGAHRSQVTLDYGEDGVGVVVANSGPVVTDAGSPRGLLGLRERAAAFGGTMEAGPQPLGGWRVALWLPRDKEAQT